MHPFALFAHPEFSGVKSTTVVMADTKLLQIFQRFEAHAVTDDYGSHSCNSKIPSNLYCWMRMNKIGMRVRKRHFCR